MDTLTGRQLLQALKASALPRGPLVGLAVGHPVEAFLRPVATQRELLNWDDVHMLSDWRNRFVQAFLTEFKADPERTARWLTDVVGPDDTRILFMLEDGNSGETVGYVGLAFIDWTLGTGEVDSLVRGSDAPRGFMERAVLTLLSWAHLQLGLRMLGARVRSDNSVVRAFFKKLGFVEGRRVPLRRSDTPGMVAWIEDPSLPAGDPSLIQVILPEEKLKRAIR